MSLDDAVAAIKGVGGKKANLLKKLGISTVRDLFYYMPRSYESQGSSVDISGLEEGEICNICAVIAAQPVLRRIKKGLSLVTFSLQDETGNAEAVFFLTSLTLKTCIPKETGYLSSAKSNASEGNCSLRTPIWRRMDGSMRAFYPFTL